MTDLFNFKLLQTEYQFRTEKEITNERKGSYLKGCLYVPDVSHDFTVQLSLVSKEPLVFQPHSEKDRPSSPKRSKSSGGSKKAKQKAGLNQMIADILENGEDANPFRIHPNFLHLSAKKGHGSRTVCRSSDWKLELKWNADDRKMEAINRGEAGGDFDVTRSVKSSERAILFGIDSIPSGSIYLSNSPRSEDSFDCSEEGASVSNSKHIKDGIALTIITSGQKTNTGVTVAEIIKQRLVDSFETDSYPRAMSEKHRDFARKHPEKYIETMTQYITEDFKGKNGKMHRAGIEVILRRDNHDIERTQPDETLTNKGGKKFTSSLEVEKIRPEAVCLENGGEIYVTFANPVNAKSIEAIIRHSSDYEMVSVLSTKSQGQMIVSFPITKCKIRELRLEDASRPMDGYCIHFRPSADNTDVLPPSNATIKFIEHVDPECLCGHGSSSLTKSTPGGNKRRRSTDQQRQSEFPSSSSSSSVTPIVLVESFAQVDGGHLVASPAGSNGSHSPEDIFMNGNESPDQGIGDCSPYLPDLSIYPDLLDELNQEGSEPPLPTARKSLVTDGWIDEQDVEALEEGLSERRVIQSGPSFVQSFRPRSGVNGGKYLSVEEDGPASPSSSRMHSSSSGMNSAKAVDAALWNWIKDSRPYVLACDAWEMRWPVVLGLALTFLAVLLSS